MRQVYPNVPFYSKVYSAVCSIPAGQWMPSSSQLLPRNKISPGSWVWMCLQPRCTHTAGGVQSKGTADSHHSFDTEDNAWAALLRSPRSWPAGEGGHPKSQLVLPHLRVNLGLLQRLSSIAGARKQKWCTSKSSAYLGQENRLELGTCPQRSVNLSHAALLFTGIKQFQYFSDLSIWVVFFLWLSFP